MAHPHVDETTKTEPTLELLPGVSALLRSASRGTGQDVIESLAEEMAGMEAWGPPKLIIAVEHDHWRPGTWNWRDTGYSRGMQICQVGRVKLCHYCELMIEAVDHSR
jgi:hypothetical protein